VTRVTECVCEYNKDCPEGRERIKLQYSFVIIIFHFFFSCHLHDPPTLTEKNFARRLLKSVEHGGIPAERRFLESMELRGRHACEKCVDSASYLNSILSSQSRLIQTLIFTESGDIKSRQFYSILLNGATVLLICALPRVQLSSIRAARRYI